MTEPLSDPGEVLDLLFTPSREEMAGRTKLLMPYAMLGPKPHTVPPEEYRYLPFIEWCWYGGLCDLEFLDARCVFVTSKAADALIREGWVEETDAAHVYKISLLGIAVASARRQKKLERAVDARNVPDAN